MFHGAYIGNGKILIKTAWGMRLIASSSDMSLMPTLMVDGVIEIGLTNWLLKNKEEFLGGLVIDVGANIGYFTVLLGCIVGDKGAVIAYEANPKVYSLLKESIYLGQLQDRTSLINKAVSSGFSTIPFYTSTKYQGNSSIHEHGDSYKTQFATDEFETIDVKSEPLDIYSSISGRIKLIKIDVEGAEYEVLRGMEKLLDYGMVENIVLELNKKMLGDDVDRLHALFVEMQNKYEAQFYVFSPSGDTVAVIIDDIFAQDYIDNILIKIE